MPQLEMAISCNIYIQIRNTNSVALKTVSTFTCLNKYIFCLSIQSLTNIRVHRGKAVTPSLPRNHKISRYGATDFSQKGNVFFH